MKIHLIIVFFVVCIFKTYSQDTLENLIQFSGRLLNKDKEPIVFSHVLILNNMRGNITDTDGLFTLVVEPGDTVMLTSVGYKASYIHITDTTPGLFITEDYYLTRDTINIEEIVVYPWKSYEEFKQAFLNLELPEDDLERARKNIALLKTQIILDNSPNPSANFRSVLNEQYQKTFTEGQLYPTFSLTNPLAWARFFNALQSGDLKYDERLKEKNRYYNRSKKQ